MSEMSHLSHGRRPCEKGGISDMKENLEVHKPKSVVTTYLQQPKKEDWPSFRIQIISVMVFIFSRYWSKSIIRIPLTHYFPDFGVQVVNIWIIFTILPLILPIIFHLKVITRFARNHFCWQILADSSPKW